MNLRTLFRDLIRPIEIYRTMTVGHLAITYGERGVIHFLPKDREDRMWGIYEDWHDGPHYMIGLGRFALICLSYVELPAWLRKRVENGCFHNVFERRE